MTPDIALFNSPALRLMAGIEALGCRITADEKRLLVTPASRLSALQRDGVQEHRRALAALVRACDDGVQARRESFAAQFKAGPASRVPAFLFRSGVAYEAAICFSCGDRLAEVRFGRCWRCALAWRLVAVRVPAATAAALDEARVCA